MMITSQGTALISATTAKEQCRHPAGLWWLYASFQLADRNRTGLNNQATNLQIGNTQTGAQPPLPRTYHFLQVISKVVQFLWARVPGDAAH
jgi:hypothetical protein